MSFDEGKTVTLPDFLGQVRTRIETGGNLGALSYFDSFLQKGLPETLKKMARPDWDGNASAGDFDEIYPLAAIMLRDAAGRNLSEVHRDSYEVAHQVSVAFRDELNETFHCTEEHEYDLIPIKSFLDMAIEGGIVKVEDGTVTLTSQGEEMAQSVMGTRGVER